MIMPLKRGLCCKKINSLSKSAKTAGDWFFCQDRILFGIYFRF